MRPLIFLVVMVTTGCQTELVVPQRITADPVPNTCPAECTQTCLPAIWPKWEGDPLDPRTWDLLPEQVIAALRTIAETCDRGRAECVKCIERPERVGLTCGVKVACGGSQ